MKMCSGGGDEGIPSLRGQTDDAQNPPVRETPQGCLETPGEQPGAHTEVGDRECPGVQGDTGRNVHYLHPSASLALWQLGFRTVLRKGFAFPVPVWSSWCYSLI